MSRIIERLGYIDALRSCIDTTKQAERPSSLEATIGFKPHGTSRFDTRIDWILLPPEEDMKATGVRCFCAPEDEEGYQVVCADHITDHNLVLATVIFEATSGRSIERNSQLAMGPNIESLEIATASHGRQSVTVTLSRKKSALSESDSNDDDHHGDDIL